MVLWYELKDHIFVLVIVPDELFLSRIYVTFRFTI